MMQTIQIPALHPVLRRMRASLCCRIRALLAESDAAFIDRFPALVAEVEAVVRHEEAILERRQDRTLHERRENNATILCALHRMASLVEMGNAASGRQLVAALYQALSLRRFGIAPALMAWPARPMATRLRRTHRTVPPAWPRPQRALH